MKKMMLIIPLVSVCLTSCMSVRSGELYNVEDVITDPAVISLDNVAFDEDSLFTIYDEAGGIIGYYDRFENRSFPVKSAYIYNTDQEMIYTIVPVVNAESCQFHIQDQNGLRGMVSMKTSIEGFSLVYINEVDFFGKPYAFEISYKAGTGSIEQQYIVKYDDQVVIFSNLEIDYTDRVSSGFITEQSFLDDNQTDVCAWAVMLLLYSEVSLELGKQW